MKSNFGFVLAVATLTTFQLALAADITGTVTLKGTPPPEVKNTQVMDDATCGKLHATDVTTHHYLVGPKGELANVVVQLKGISGKPAGAATPPVVLDQKGCLYEPQIFAIQTGQKILVKNSDLVMHNVHINPTATGNNQANNSPTQMPSSPEVTFTFNKPESFMKFQCDVHPWMFAWVTVVDHPYFAVTDKDGKFTIKDVPPGKYTVTASHRKAAPTGVDQEVEVKADGAKADFTLEVPAVK